MSTVKQDQRAIVDDTLLVTARRLATFADTAGEQELAHGAFRGSPTMNWTWRFQLLFDKRQQCPLRPAVL